jgi:type II secretory pathway component GspD/PulD (secretin)
LTLNNRRATILDGQRVTYITRYSSYTNLYETDSMDAGLTLSVLPSLGESGYITLKINAEMTTLEGKIAGSPIKTGQLIENTIVVKDGESVLLGGLTRSSEARTRKRFPILGYVLPFIFSREVTNRDEIESYMILTPKVVDFATTLDEETKAKLEGK